MIATNGSYLIVKEVRKALCKFRERGMDEGSCEDLTLPRRQFVMLKSCLDVLLAKKKKMVL